MSELPYGWAHAQLADLGHWSGGGTPSKGRSEFWTGGTIPWVSPKDMKSDVITDTENHITDAAVAGSSTNVVPAGSVLAVTRSGILRRTFPVAVTATDVALNQDLKALAPTEGVSPYYVALALKWQERTILQECAKDGTTVDSINFPALLSRSVPLAPTNEQLRIVAAVEEALSRIEAGLTMVRRVGERLKLMRSAVLLAGVTGRLTLQDPHEGSGAELLATITLDGRRSGRVRADLSTEMPDLPENWATASWRAVGYSQNGRAFPSSEYAITGTRLLRPGNLYANGQVEWTSENTRCLPSRYADNFPSYIVGPDEIVMNLTAQSLKDEFLGRVCMTGPHDEPVLLNQRIARLTPVGLNSRFVFYVLKSPLFRRFVEQLNTGSLIQHMFTSQLDQFMLPIPPRGEQDRIVAQIEERLTFLDHLQESALLISKRVPSLRAATLTAAFSGKLVPQNAADESAAVLVERLRDERTSALGQRQKRAGRSRVRQERAEA